MKRLSIVPLLVAIMGLGALASVAKAQSPAGAGCSFSNAFSPSPNAKQPQPVQTYRKPTEKIKVRNYLTAVYAWFPRRYDAEDGFRMGNYTVLTFAAENIALEFIYGGQHTLFGCTGRSVPPGTNSAVTTNP